jgi:mxaJ protein
MCLVSKRRFLGWRVLGALGLGLALILPVSTPAAEHPAPSPRVLRVAADPNNLPFSNEAKEGFENKIAELLARDLDAELQYVWHAQRRGFFRETLKSGDADVVMGVPTDMEMALTTQPYYRSTYVFATRQKGELHIASLDDPILHEVKVGVQLVGNDGVDTPPAHALAKRDIINNVVGFTLYGDYRQDSPPARIVDAVANGKVDVAVVWGPLAGYFAKREPVPLSLVPVSPAFDGPALRFVFDISMGVRRKDRALRETLNEFITHRRPEIDALLDQYGVPRLPVSDRTARVTVPETGTPAARRKE